jgi:hypothetical protein
MSYVNRGLSILSQIETTGAEERTVRPLSAVLRSGARSSVRILSLGIFILFALLSIINCIWYVGYVHPKLRLGLIDGRLTFTTTPADVFRYDFISGTRYGWIHGRDGLVSSELRVLLAAGPTWPRIEQIDYTPTDQATDKILLVRGSLYVLPLWFAASSSFLLAVCFWRQELRIVLRLVLRKKHSVRCGKCGYCLIGNQSGICPECGTMIPGDTFAGILQGSCGESSLRTHNRSAG